MYVANVLQPIIDACEAVLKFWHGLLGDFTGSWGWSIILLTFTVRLFILPLTFKGVKSMQRLQQLQPEIKRIQERYKAEIASNPSFGPIPNLAHKVTGDPVLLAALIILYVGTQLGATAVTAFSADPTQRRIMFALPFVFTIFIINFQAGLIVYWITTNVWTIGQQLAVKKLFPKPEPIARDEKEAARPARGKPATAMAATDGRGGASKPKEKARASGNGSGASKPPPAPRKRKKRS